MSKQNVAEFILNALDKENIDTVFLVPGGMIDPFLSGYLKTNMKMIVTAHEAGAAYMADGYARAKQSFGVCLGIGGPGITNMITAIAAADADRSPVLVIGGSIPKEWEGLEAVQDSSPSGISDIEFMRPITAYAQQIPTVSVVPRFFKKAIRSMFALRKRPAFLSIPLYIQEQTLEESYTPIQPSLAPKVLDRTHTEKVSEILSRSTRITLLVGNGSIHSQACDQIQTFAEQYAIPVVTTLRAKGAISEDHPLSYGVFGIAGSLQGTELILKQSEVLIVLGASLNEQNAVAVGDLNQVENIIHVDINPQDLEDSRYNAVPIIGDVGEFLIWLLNDSTSTNALHQGTTERNSWLKEINKIPFYDSHEDRHTDQLPMHPARVLSELRKSAPKDSVVVVDSGAHTFFTAHHWTSYAPNECFVWTNNGPMGYAVSGAIGAKLARPQKPCIAIIGDGGMSMHGIEIQTAVRYNVPIVIVVINNGALGNVYLRAYREKKEGAIRLTESPVHDWAKFAQSFGAEGVSVEHYEQLQSAFQSALSSYGPFLIDARCGKNYPTPNPGESALL